MDDTKKMAIIATKGTLDWAYPPFILASTAAALGYEVQIFFTFYGLQMVRKDLSGLKVSPLGNPGMPMKMPFGPKWFKGINWNIQWHFVFKKTIPFFWIPAHTITFLLPADFQVLFAALLSVMLGLILAIASLKSKN